VCLVAASCTDQGTPPPPAPFISELKPDSAFVGDTIRVQGGNFGATQGSSLVKFGSVAAVVYPSWSATEARVKVPAGILAGNVTTTVEGMTSNGVMFKVRIPVGAPSLTLLQPDSGAVGDSIRILGSGFGSTQGASSVTFGGQPVTVFKLWSNTEIRAKIPAGSTSGPVFVTVNGLTSNGLSFKVLSPASSVSFSAYVLPILTSTCTGCHGGTNNLFLNTYANVVAGTSVHGPVVVSGNGEGSVIIQKLRGTASFGARMPQGGPYLSTSKIDSISLWIQQGASNN